MKKYIVKRLIISVFILIFVAFIIYVLMRSLPTSYLEQVARQKSMQPGSKSFEEWMEQLSATYGMDKGIIPGFLAWAGRASRITFRLLPALMAMYLLLKRRRESMFTGNICRLPCSFR